MDAKINKQAAGVTQLVECQPSKLKTTDTSIEKTSTSDSDKPNTSNNPGNRIDIDPDLAKLNDAWSSLPDVVKAGILAMVEAAS